MLDLTTVSPWVPQRRQSHKPYLKRKRFKVSKVELRHIFLPNVKSVLKCYVRFER